MRLDTQRLQTLDQIRQFLADNRPIDLRPQTRAEAYAFVAETLERFDYPDRGKADKGLLRRFLVEVAGLSRAQVTRLLRQHRATGAIADRRGPRRASEWHGSLPCLKPATYDIHLRDATLAPRSPS